MYTLVFAGKAAILFPCHPAPVAYRAGRSYTSAAEVITAFRSHPCAKRTQGERKITATVTAKHCLTSEQLVISTSECSSCRPYWQVRLTLFSRTVAAGDACLISTIFSSGFT